MLRMSRESSKALCKAIASGNISAVKDLCQKRIKASSDNTLGHFSVGVSWKCACLAIPNHVNYYSKKTLLKVVPGYSIGEFDFCKPLKLCKLICNGRCKCTRSDPYKPITRKISPLVVACFFGHVNIVSYLLKVDRTAINFNGYMTPLMMTAVCKNKETAIKIAKMLLKSGADFNIVDRLSRFHILELASLHGNLSMIRFLLKRGVKVNSSMISPLTLARNKSCRRLLLSAGAKVLHRLTTRCPLRNALQFKSSITCIRDFLESPTFQKDHVYLDLDVTLMQLCFGPFRRPGREQSKILDLLLQHGLLVDSCEVKKPFMNIIMKNAVLGYPPYHDEWNTEEIGPATFICIQRYLPGALRLLLKRGANVNLTNFFGTTALMVLAVLGGNSTDKIMLPILFKYGADLNVRDIRGCSAVYYAIENERRNAFLLESLLKRNVELFSKSGANRRFPKNKSLIFRACELGHYRKALLLIRYGCNIRKETWLMKQSLWPSRMKKSVLNTELIDEILSLFREPDTLQQLCRIEIRHFLGTYIATSVLKQLKLPNVIQDYLLFA